MPVLVTHAVLLRLHSLIFSNTNEGTFLSCRDMPSMTWMYTGRKRESFLGFIIEVLPKRQIFEVKGRIFNSLKKETVQPVWYH